MDVNLIRTLITVLCFLAFIGIVVWAYSGKQRARFEEAANLPFEDEDMQQSTLRIQSKNEAHQGGQ